MAILKIQKGSQFSIPFTLTLNGTAVTTSNASDVRIKLGDILKTYSDSELTYSAGDWLYPLTEDDTWELGSEVQYQVSVKDLSGNIYPSEPARLMLADSIITEKWTVS